MRLGESNSRERPKTSPPLAKGPSGAVWGLPLAEPDEAVSRLFHGAGSARPRVVCAQCVVLVRAVLPPSRMLPRSIFWGFAALT
mmetsp:Transcript_65774/g.109291  ORF Transcript_65774/g.109291 Transcript_65774/m.109291 type:complete len:84 (-) Transcript_65774:235-486(-)